MVSEIVISDLSEIHENRRNSDNLSPTLEDLCILRDRIIRQHNSLISWVGGITTPLGDSNETRSEMSSQAIHQL